MSKSNSFQKVLAVFLLLFISAFFLKEYKTLLARKKFISGSHSEYLTQDYPVNSIKSFVVLIVANDNFPFVDKNLRSISGQNYPAFNIVFIDTSSDLNNLSKAKKLAQDLGIEKKISFYKSSEMDEYKVIYYQALNHFKDDEIVVHLEASDWFADSYVLERLNEIYKDPDVWLTYSEHINRQDQLLGKEKTLFKNSKKISPSIQAPWLVSHFKTYYVGLAKQVNIEMLSKKSSSNIDEIIMKTLLHISKWHIRFIPEVLFIHNEISKNEQNDLQKIGSFSCYQEIHAEKEALFSPPKKIGY